MSVLRDVLDATERERELKAKELAALRTFERLNSTTPREARNKYGWTPELTDAVRRYIGALTERGEYMIRRARHLEETLRAIEGKEA
jgi:hypothetical protein